MVSSAKMYFHLQVNKKHRPQLGKEFCTNYQAYLLYFGLVSIKYEFDTD